MAVGSPPTVRRRQLGRELRRLREDAGLLAEALAERLHCSPSRVSRIETARIRIGPGTVHEILDALGVHGDERARLVALAREAEEPGWWQAYTDALPLPYATYISLESEAVSLKAFEPTLVYGLLQTREYARAVIEPGARHQQPSEVAARIEARLARQRVLTKPDPVRLHVVLDEAVLHHAVGGHEVLRAQLQRLVELARRPNVTIQVLPFEKSSALVFFPGPVVIMGFPDPDAPPVMYLESVATDLYVERPETVQAHLDLYDRLVEQALSPSRSIRKIQSLLTGI
ncbi:MAG TPA: helix-turn-helix transcriptional regulator [Rugosimonospora sp.]|nr:helix-turn-helix transcriptional regulator [Rugosimonospora sp.]